MPRRYDKSAFTHSLELSARLGAWRAKPGTITGSELVETALVEGMDVEAEAAARALLLQGSSATDLVKKQATLLLARLQQKSLGPYVIQQPNLGVALWRQRTRLAPRDAIAWVELSLAYVMVGKIVDAKRCMLIALQLAPHDRYVLRSASRLFLHLGDPERAHDLLKQNTATKADPWLIAGEIALAGVAERKPIYFRAGTGLVEDEGLQPKQISELAGSLGTVHLLDGNRKARKLFRVSLIDPTGNSLAQAEWASPKIGDLLQNRKMDQVIESSEARAFKAYWKADFKGALSASIEWAEEEPLSARPCEQASNAAITIEDYERALQLADTGLLRDPKSLVLHNNRAFALIALGRLEEASTILEMQLANHSDHMAAPLMATSGLLALRTGITKLGVQLYRKAMSVFRRANQPQGEALALAYFAQEAARAGLPEAPAILHEAKQVARRTTALPELGVVLGRAEMWNAAVAHRNMADFDKVS